MAASHYRFICNGVKQIVEKITIPKNGSMAGQKELFARFSISSNEILITLL
jgi:hypothetical protein